MCKRSNARLCKVREIDDYDILNLKEQISCLIKLILEVR